MNFSLLPLIALVLVSAVAAVIDVRTRHIPNRLVLLGLVGGALLNLASHSALPHASLAQALGRGGLSLVSGMVVCAVVPLLLYRIGAMGGGDVKLLVVVGASVGPLVGMQIQVAAFVIGAVFAIVQLALTGQLKRMLGNALCIAINPLLPVARRRPISGTILNSQPFGPAIFASVLLVALSTEWT